MPYSRHYHHSRSLWGPQGPLLGVDFSSPLPAGEGQGTRVSVVSEKTDPCSAAVVRILLRLFHKKLTRLWLWSSACRRATLLFSLAVVASPRRWLA
jgi:hypothetical protein